MKANEEIDQLRVQLAGCACAALGHTKEPAKEGMYGWSPAYQDVLDLRQKYDKLAAQRLADSGVQVPGECKWNEEDEYWATQCDRAFTFLADGPIENDYKHCPGCGKKIDALDADDTPHAGRKEE